ncbi:MAG TPA: hypothetical protein VGD05_14015 [Pyrinomonadaceae bacterium]
MDKILLLSIFLLFFAGCGELRTAENQNADEKLKTVFLHIEGFSKSKSGAI